MRHVIDESAKLNTLLFPITAACRHVVSVGTFDITAPSEIDSSERGTQAPERQLIFVSNAAIERESFQLLVAAPSAQTYSIFN